MARPPKHGLTGTPTYVSWASMKARCKYESSGNYANYGGRGITYDNAWECFENFLADMGLRPAGTTLDRVDNLRGYYKANCRWTTASTQQQNKRAFKQPAGRTYGGATCMDCGAAFTRKSPIARRCPPCVMYSRRYHKSV